MNRYFYKSTISDFVNASEESIFGQIAMQDEGDSGSEQKFAWSEEIDTLKEALLPWKDEYAEIIFEYSIPRLGKRIDVVLLLRGIVFTIEFKAGQTSFLQSDMEQVMDYSLDLKNFHLGSHDRTIVPILVATKAKRTSHELNFSVYDDQIYNPLLTNKNKLGMLIENVIERENAQPSQSNDFAEWAISRFSYAHNYRGRQCTIS